MNANGAPEAVNGRGGGVSWVGAYGLVGNVWEWTNSRLRPYPFSADVEDGVDAADSLVLRVVRGGSWAEANQLALTAIYRGSMVSNSTDPTGGFRCVLDV
jgi:formylglycine-generating enzyme required for sulfatase activity